MILAWHPAGFHSGFSLGSLLGLRLGSAQRESGHSPWSLHWHLESTTINSNGKVIREREEDFRSNIPGLSGENFNSQPEVPSHGLEWNSPYLNSMRLQQQGLERLMEQQQLDMQEEMSKMIELFWR